MNPFTVFLLGTLVLLSRTSAFQVSLPSCRRSTYIMILPKAAPQRQSRQKFFVQRSFSPLWGSFDDKENVLTELELESSDSMPVIVRGSEDDDLDDALWDDIEGGQPPQWMVMKELLGINIFTYVLGALIAFFLGMNFFLGPGWLGQGIGIPGAGFTNDVSNSLPDVVDLSSPNFRL